MSRDIDLIVIHCTATPNGKPFTVEDIDKWHRQKGYAKIGYHKVIYTDGTIHDGRPIEQVGAHAEGYNAHSIGVCLLGTDKFKKEQWFALKNLVITLRDEYGVILIVGHRDLPKVQKECPGFSVSAWKGNDMQPLEGHLLK